MRIEYREGLGWVRVKRGRGKRVAPPVLEDPRVAFGRRVEPKNGAAGNEQHTQEPQSQANTNPSS